MKKIFLLSLFVLSIVQAAIGQTATGVFTQVPCNNDGIYTVSTTGLPLPITYTYYYGNAAPVVHANINSATDQLTNIPMNDGSWIWCQATSGTLIANAQGNYTPSLYFTASGTSPICPATMGTLTATYQSGTTGPYTYDWTNSATLTTYSGNNASVPIGQYSLKVTDVTTGCVLEISDTAIFVEQLSNVTAAMSSTPASCTNGTATAVASGGTAPYTYLWANGATTPTITGLMQGWQSVTVTDAIGCQSNFLGTNVTQNPSVTVNTTVTNATCVQSDGSVIAFGSGGVNPYTYVWSNGQTGNTATALTGQTSYQVIATDANGCTGNGWAYVNSSTPITVTYTTTPSSCTASTGTATLTAVGGTAPYTYNWNTSPSVSGAVLSSVAPGTYSFQVTDAVGCVRTGSAVISPVSTINANANGGSVTCPNTTGNANISATGSNPPFSFLWSNGATTNQLTGVSLGGYSCVVTDAVGCSVTRYTSINSVSPLNVAVSTVPATCIYNTDGSATATVTGGTPPYTYSYTGGSTSSTATALGVGNYYVYVTDANGCTKSKHFQIGNSNTTNSCYCTISSHVYLDANVNCNYDIGETGVENVMIHCSGIGYTFTDANGYYSFQVPTGTYTITEQVNAYYPLAACQSNGVSASVVASSGCFSVVNFANDINIINDLKIVIPVIN